MILFKFNILQIIFIILVPIALLLLAFLFIFLPLSKRKAKSNFVEYCHKEIYKIAFNEDYYLINDFYFRVEQSKVARINHILFGEKYIYVLTDQYYEGDLSGKDTDKSLILIDSRNRKFYADNLYLSSKTLVNYLSTATGIDQSLFIGVVVVNNGCRLAIESTSKQFYMIQRNRLKKLVKAIESREVGKINASQLDNAVKAIDRLNRKKKNK